MARELSPHGWDVWVIGDLASFGVLVDSSGKVAVIAPGGPVLALKQHGWTLLRFVRFWERTGALVSTERRPCPESCGCHQAQQPALW